MEPPIITRVRVGLVLMLAATMVLQLTCAQDSNWGMHRNLNVTSSSVVQTGLPPSFRAQSSRPIFNTTRWLVISASEPYANPVANIATLTATPTPSLQLSLASQSLSPNLNGSALSYAYSTNEVISPNPSAPTINWLVFGGVNSAGTRNTNLIQIKASSSASAISTPSTYPAWPALVLPAGLERSIAVSDSRGSPSNNGNTVFIFGGINTLGSAEGGTFRSAENCLFPADCWALLVHLIKPVPRVTPPGVEYNGVWYIFGGDTLGGVLGDTWAFNFDDQNWTDLSYPNGPINSYPPARKSHSLTLLEGSNKFGIGPCMLMAGGIGVGGTVLDDLWIFDFTTKKWELISMPGASYTGRADATLLAHPYLPKAYLYGGRNNAGAAATDLLELSFDLVPPTPPSTPPFVSPAYIMFPIMPHISPPELPLPQPNASPVETPSAPPPKASPEEVPTNTPVDAPNDSPADTPVNFEPISNPMDPPPSDVPLPPSEPPAVIITPVAPPVITRCVGTAPNPAFTCIDGAWIAAHTVTVPTFVVTGDEGQIIIINGSLVVTGDVTFSGTGASIIVQNGCANVGGNVVVDLTEEQARELESTGRRQVTLIQQSPSCASSLETTRVKGNTAGLSSCKKFVAETAKSSTSPTQLSAVLYIDTSNCKTRWIIVGSAVGGGVALVAVAIFSLCANKKVRTKFFPSWVAAQEATHLEDHSKPSDSTGGKSEV